MKEMRIVRFAGNLLMLTLFCVLTFTACGEQQAEDENIGMMSFSDGFYAMLQAKGFVNEDGTVDYLKKGENGATALHLAANSGTTTDAEILIALGADIEAVDSGFSATPLLWATYDKNPDVAAVLVEAGANVNAQNGFGNTPLHNAAMNDNQSLITLLLQNGADKTIKNIDGMTPEEFLPADSLTTFDID